MGGGGLVKIKKCLLVGKMAQSEGSTKAQGQKWVRNYTVSHSTFGCLSFLICKTGSFGLFYALMELEE